MKKKGPSEAEKEAIRDLANLLVRAEHEAQQSKKEPGRADDRLDNALGRLTCRPQVSPERNKWWQQHEKYPVVVDYAFGVPVFFLGVGLAIVAVNLLERPDVAFQFSAASFACLSVGGLAIDRAKRKLMR